MQRRSIRFDAVDSIPLTLLIKHQLRTFSSSEHAGHFLYSRICLAHVLRSGFRLERLALLPAIVVHRVVLKVTTRVGVESSYLAVEARQPFDRGTWC